jgi:hypothetical protein
MIVPLLLGILAAPAPPATMKAIQIAGFGAPRRRR